jgi:DNA-binding HxlR family transcriptional regulator
MRTYAQYCAVAKALDVIGDRWNLLIVRELMLQGPCRYTDLLNGLPGIATNLLADRLRDLEDAGVTYREDAPPPIATTLFRLTPRGEELKATLRELIQWGAELMTERSERDAFRGHWLGAPARTFLTPQAPDRPKVTIELRAGEEEPFTIEAAHGEISTRAGAADQPDLTLTGAPELILGVMAARLDVEEARARGLRWQGNLDALRRLQLQPAVAER